MIKSLIIKNPFISPYKRAKLLKSSLNSMGENCQIFYKVSFGSEPYLIKIGDNVKITYGCKFITHDGGMHVLRVREEAIDSHVYGCIKIGNNVFLGNDVTVMPGVTIGDNCIIGTGAIVTKSIPDNSVAVGVPAKVINSIDAYYETQKKYFLNTTKMEFDEKRIFLLEELRTNSNKFISK